MENANSLFGISSKSSSNSSYVKFTLNNPVKMRILPKKDSESRPFKKLITHDLKNQYDPRNGEVKKFFSVHCPRNEDQKCITCETYFNLKKEVKNSDLSYANDAVEKSGLKPMDYSYVRVIERGSNEEMPKFFKLRRTIEKALEDYVTHGRTREEIDEIKDEFNQHLQQLKSSGATKDQIDAFNSKVSIELDRLSKERVNVVDETKGYDIIITKVLKDESKKEDWTNIEYKVRLATKKPKPIFAKADGTLDEERLKRVVESAPDYVDLYKNNIFTPDEIKSITKAVVDPMKNLFVGGIDG